MKILLETYELPEKGFHKSVSIIETDDVLSIVDRNEYCCAVVTKYKTFYCKNDYNTVLKEILDAIKIDVNMGSKK